MSAGAIPFGRTCGAVAALLAVAAAALVPGPAAAQPDSTEILHWSLLYAGRIDLKKCDEFFPWNDPEAESHLNDRLVSMLELSPLPAVDLFVKGASGYRRERDGLPRGRFALAQGHAAFELHGGALRGRLFLRERLFRTRHRLLPLVSNDSPFLEGRGQGARLDLIDWPPRLRVRYIESMLRSEDPAIHGGLPLFRGGGDVFRLLSASLRLGGGAGVGLAASEVRSMREGDGVMIAADCDFAFRGVRLVAELARSVRGRWDDLRSVSLFGTDFSRARLRSLNRIFSPGAAFSSEVHGLTAHSERLGTVSVVPGYRFYGPDFFDPQGEIAGGLVESYLTSWWRHPRCDAGASLELYERYEGATGERHEIMRLISRARVQGGFDLAGNILFSDGRRPSVLFSVVDEHSQARILTTVRIDDTGGGNDLSFLAEGQMNLSSSWSLRNTLYLYRSAGSYYSAELEFRPGRRFLLRGAIGSFRPFEEDITMNRALDPAPPAGERWLSIYTRVWFGTL